MKLEILAPCGSRESVIAAVRCGANAVYLGMKDFNARRNADNFDEEELREVIDYCHAREVKVYITVNTLISDNEMKTAYKTVQTAMHCGADGFIVQDLGLAKLIKKCFPSARLHASTQCSAVTPDGFNKLKELGFCRAVLPREMSLEEIKDIRSKTDIELEIFVHGALCMCVSGQCYLSSMLGQRSGNRGLCAQPCRLSFSADNSGSFDLSLKDLSLISKINEIKEAGVISLKIEGRMKRPEYVAAAVTACKNAINGNYLPEDEGILKSVFSRSGFTDGYFTGKRQDMFGIRSKEDVVAASSVLKDLSRLYEKETTLIPINLKFVCKKGEKIKLTASTDKKTVFAEGAYPEEAINKPLTEDRVKERLSKFGGTQYFVNSIDVELDEGLIASASEINSLRRSVVEKLDCNEETEFKQLPFDAVHSKEKHAVPYLTARFLSASQIPENHPFKRIFLPVWADNADFINSKAGVEIPRGLFGAEDKLKARLRELKDIGVENALCSDIGSYESAKSLGFEVFGNFSLNIFNSESANMFNSPILSFELTLEQANRINARDTGIIAYGKVPLMLTRNCPVKNRIGCDKCRKQGVLTDRKGYKFPVLCSSYPCVEILNPNPIVMSDRMDEIKTDFAHFYFTNETKEEICSIISLYKFNKFCENNYTRGLYYRGVK
ncbi:MAG: U32 family peptidase [Ruminococcaceae bacterium]|nr:U32 family peptidase [Oscillospiraceae bacterium]